MNISIIIPNHNGENLLRKNVPVVIETAKSYKHGFVEIIIVDDGSTDASSQVIENIKALNKHLAIKFLGSKANYGFSTNVNKGVAAATGDIIVLLNTDVIPETGFLEKVVKHFIDKKVFASGFMDKSIEGDTVALRGRGIGKWDRWVVTHSRGDVSGSNSFWASGGSSAFRRDAWIKLGGFYEVYNPFYWEDVDLSYRAMRAGYIIHFDPDIVMRHEHEKGAIRTSYSKEEIKKIAYRNQLFFVWLNITDKSLLTRHFFWLVYYLCKAVITGDFVIVTAIIKAVMTLPEIISLRKNMKRKGVVTDRQILSAFNT